MISASFLAGEWTDIVPHPQGYAQVALEQPGTATAYVNGVQVWRQQVGWGLYLRATVIDGRVVAAHQRHSDGECFVFDGAHVLPLGPAFGQNGIAWKGALLYVQRAPDRSDEFDLSKTGLAINTPPPNGIVHASTSQGFHDPLGLLFTDAAHAAVPGLIRAFTRGGLSIGQSPTTRQLRLAYNGQFSIAYDGDAFEPRLVQLNATTWVACARTPRGALTLTLTPPFVPDVVTPTPTPTHPIPTPTPEPSPVQLEPKHSALIEDFADRFGLPGFSKEEGQAWVAKLAGTFKARFPSEGWGTKRASNSRPLSNESIARRVGGTLWGYDLIIGAGAPGQHLASHAHAENISDQVFVDVETRDWLGGVTPAPPPTPTPTPTPQPQPTTCRFQPAPVDLTPVLQEIQSLRAEFEAYRQRYEAVEHTTRGEIKDLVERVLRMLRGGFSFRVLSQTANGSFKDRAE